MIVLNLLKPDWEPGLSITKLPIKHFQDKGIKALLLDVDKTLLPGSDEILHDSVKDWVKEASSLLYLHLLSNNPSRKRIGSVANQLGLKYTCGAAKPRRKALREVITKARFSPLEVAIIGDRIFTDVIAGNRLGLYTVLVRPLGNDGNPSSKDYLQRIEQMISKSLVNKEK